MQTPKTHVEYDGLCLIVDDLLKISQSKPMREVKITELAWNDDIVNQLDLAHIDEVKTVYPLIVVRAYISKHRSHLVVLDGIHRLAKLKQQGRTLAKVRLLSRAELEEICEQRFKLIC